MNISDRLNSMILPDTTNSTTTTEENYIKMYFEYEEIRGCYNLIDEDMGEDADSIAYAYIDILPITNVAHKLYIDMCGEEFGLPHSYDIVDNIVVSLDHEYVPFGHDNIIKIVNMKLEGRCGI